MEEKTLKNNSLEINCQSLIEFSSLIKVLLELAKKQQETEQKLSEHDTKINDLINSVSILQKDQKEKGTILIPKEKDIENSFNVEDLNFIMNNEISNDTILNDTKYVEKNHLRDNKRFPNEENKNEQNNKENQESEENDNQIINIKNQIDDDNNNNKKNENENQIIKEKEKEKETGFNLNVNTV